MVTRRQFLKLCISSLASVSAVQLLTQLPRGSGAANRDIPVLLYHRVGYTKGYLTITPERFASDLEQLANQGYRTITLGQFEQFLLDREIELPEKPVLITFDDGYADNYEKAFPLLQKYNMSAVFYIITGMVGQPERLTSERIREMVRAGMSIGSHTVSHRPLGNLSIAEAQTELSLSRFALEDMIGQAVQSVSYPRGSYNNDTLKLVEDNGYIDGFTTLHGKSSRTTHHYVLRRIPIFSYDGDILSVMAKRGRPD